MCRWLIVGAVGVGCTAGSSLRPPAQPQAQTLPPPRALKSLEAEKPLPPPPVESAATNGDTSATEQKKSEDEFAAEIANASGGTLRADGTIVIHFPYDATTGLLGSSGDVVLYPSPDPDKVPAWQAGGRGKQAGYRGPFPPSPTLGQPTVGPGLDPATVRRYIKRNLNKLEYCYDKELIAKPTHKRTVIAKFTIGEDGHVTSSIADGVTTAEDCIAGVIREIEFPKPKGGVAVDVRYPVIFPPAS